MDRRERKDFREALFKPRHNPANKYVQYCLQKNSGLMSKLEAPLSLI